MIAATLAALLSTTPAHADAEVDAVRAHLAAISAATHTMVSDRDGAFRSVALDAQHHNQELAPLIMRLETAIPADARSDIGDRVLTQILSLDAQLGAATAAEGDAWRTAADDIIRAGILLTELSTAFLHTVEPLRADSVAAAE